MPQWQRAAEECECILEDREETFAGAEMQQDPKETNHSSRMNNFNMQYNGMIPGICNDILCKREKCSDVLDLQTPCSTHEDCTTRYSLIHVQFVDWGMAF